VGRGQRGGAKTAAWGAAAWRRARRPLLIAAVYLAAWYPLDQAAQRFQTAPDLSVWYPPAGLDVALLLVRGLRYAPLLVFNALLHTFVLTRRPIGVVEPLLFDLVAPLAYTAAAALLVRALHVDPRLPRLRDVALFAAVAAVGAPLVVAAGQVVVLARAGLVPWGEAVGRALPNWAGIATGIGMLTPPLLLLLRRWPRLWAGRGGMMDASAPEDPAPVRARPTGWAALELVGEASALALALLAAYGTPRGGMLDYTYVLFVPLLWIAVRHGVGRAVAAVLVLNVGAALLTHAQIRPTSGLALQFGLMTVTLTGLLLGAFMGERRLLGERLTRQALHDPLTGLANRALFVERAAHAWARAARQAGPRAVLLVDLDRFKAINDGLGHAAGDAVLIAAGARLAACVRPGDTVARLGGDEFAVLIEDLGDLREAGKVAARIVDALRAPLAVGGAEVTPGASVGVAVAGVIPDATGALGAAGTEAGAAGGTDTLLRDADVALYRAKAGGRGGYQIFDAGMHAAALGRLELEGDLRRALGPGGDGLELHYQPLVELATGRVTGVEALARWRHPTRGPLPPDVFIPLAEETGLITPLTRWALGEARRQGGAWKRAGLTLSVAVNLSARDLRDPGLPVAVADLLAAHGVAADRLRLELTESVVMADAAGAAAVLARIAALGVSIAVDDFGTGYSSLAYLKRLPVDDLKIDRSFVRHLATDETDATIVASTIGLGHNLGLRVTAEGVEDGATWDRLAALRCDLAQGYYLGRPLPPADLLGWLEASPWTVVPGGAPAP